MSFVDVSVVIPCFNSTKSLERAVDSVCFQSCRPREIIIIDDRSEVPVMDCFYALYERLSEFSISCVLVQNSSNNGPSYCRNMGLKMSSYNIVAFLDSDDVWLRDKLERQVNVMQEHTEIGLCGHEVFYRQEASSFQAVKSTLKEQKESVKVVSTVEGLMKNVLRSTSTFMVRKDTKICFDIKKRHSEDYLFFLEMLFSSHQVVLINAYLSASFKRPYGDKGLSSDLLKMEQSELSNFVQLWKRSDINLISFVLASSFSLLKFLRRVVYVSFYRVVGVVKSLL